jgi:hypothetical protein
MTFLLGLGVMPIRIPVHSLPESPDQPEQQALMQLDSYLQPHFVRNIVLG